MCIDGLPFGIPGSPEAGVSGMKGRGKRAKSAELDELWPAWKTRDRLPPLDDRSVESAVQMGLLPEWVIDGVETVRRFGGVAWKHGDDIPATANGYVEKPLWNPCGLGLHARRMDHLLPGVPGEGMMVQPYYRFGYHESTDVVITAGSVSWGVTAVGQPTSCLGLFRRWTLTDYRPPPIVIPDCMADFYGCINVESIGEKVIEVHFRPTLELFPLYGDAVINHMIDGVALAPDGPMPKGEMIVVNRDTKVVDLDALGEVSDRRALVYLP